MLLEEGPTAAYDSHKARIDSRFPRGLRWGCPLGLRAWLTLSFLDPQSSSSQGVRDIKTQALGAQKLVGRQAAAQTPAQGQRGLGQLDQRSRQMGLLQRPGSGEGVRFQEVEEDDTSFSLWHSLGFGSHSQERLERL